MLQRSQSASPPGCENATGTAGIECHVTAGAIVQRWRETRRGNDTPGLPISALHDNLIVWNEL